MNGETMRLEGIAEHMRPHARDFAALVRRLGGENVGSLTLFGAIAIGVFDAARHTLHSVVELGTIDLDFLRRLAGEGLGLGKHRIAAPLIMTRAYIAASRDTFPLEFIEISQARLTVFGDDPFAGLVFDDVHVRLQCERELKSMLIGMRQGLLNAAGRDPQLATVEAAVAQGMIRTLRGMLWLRGTKSAAPADQVIAGIEKLTGRRLDGMRSAASTAGPHGWPQFQSLYRDIESLAETVNGW
ncbi:MAG: hypothetical protein HOP29_16720 [Phycisphaerales bacterium]|nr:hypothetical protein [Phycisphaerales bacterium]